MPAPRALAVPPPRGQAREALLRAAEALIREEGFAALSVERVAARAGVSKGAFFHHFATRQAMVEALLVAAASDLESRVQARVESGERFPVALVEAFVHEARTDCAFIAAMISAVVLDRSVATQVECMADAWTRRMVDDGIDEATALTVRSVLDGLVLLCLLHAPQPAPARELDLIRMRVLALLT
jgi:AcrR family transcriptional regulator